MTNLLTAITAILSIIITATAGNTFHKATIEASILSIIIIIIISLSIDHITTTK